MARPHVLVVGAGIIGASTAWHLARAGARVTVVDSTEPGGISTQNSWAWINASWGNPEPYFRLRLRAISEWHRLEREVPELRVAWVGSLLWELPPERLRSFQLEHTAWGYDVRLVDRAHVQQLEPHLAHPPEMAVHAPTEGAVEPLAAVWALLTAAQSLGATVISNNRVRSLNLRGVRVVGVETSDGPLDADEVVVAAGIGTKDLVAGVGFILPITGSPALLVRTQPHPKRLNRLVMSPAMQLRQTSDGRLLAAVGFHPRGDDADGAKAAAAALDAMRGMIRSDTLLLPEAHVVGVRPIPKDGFPVLGRITGISGLYVAVMHSGITLAPVIGRCIADEILIDQRDDLIEPYGLQRFASITDIRAVNRQTDDTRFGTDFPSSGLQC